MPDTNAAVDDAILRAIARTLRTDERVKEVSLVAGKKTDEHKRLVVTIDPARYLEPTHDVRLEIQWYRNDGFNVHYAETHADEDNRQCRWDRQSSDHSTREHFHPPPDAGEPIETRFPDDYRDVLSMILAAIGARIDDHWQDEQME